MQFNFHDSDKYEFKAGFLKFSGQLFRKFIKYWPGSAGGQRVYSGSWGRGFDFCRGRAHVPGVGGLVSAGVDPALHPSHGGR